MRLVNSFVGIVILSMSLCIAKDYPLKDIAKEFSNPKQTSSPSIMPSSKNLIASTKGIINFSPHSYKDIAEKIKSKNNLVIRIFGDSHIAGDFIPHRLRNLLFDKYHIGFTYPLYPAYHQHIGFSYHTA